MGMPDPTFSARLMASAPRRPRRRIILRTRNAVLVTLALLVPSFLCVMFASQLGPDWAAHEGHGMLGTWTSTAEHCQKDCTWTGTFTTPTTSRTYTVPAGPDGPAYSYIAPDWGFELDGVPINGGPDIDHLGQSVAAIYPDGADGVFPRGGGDVWLEQTLGTIVCGIGVLAWLWTFPRRAVRRLRRSYACRWGADYARP